MDDAPTPPLIFANRVIKQFISHSFGEGLVIEDKDYLAIRDVFRRCSGSWQKLVGGDIVHITLLSTICVGWGAIPGHKQKAPEER